jgi:hypothetical protein
MRLLRLSKIVLLTSFLMISSSLTHVYADPPLNCVSPTTTNPGNDPSCNSSGTSTNCLEYCGYSASGFRSPVAGTGIAVAYWRYGTFTVNGSSIVNHQVCQGDVCTGLVRDDNFVVTQNQVISLLPHDGTDPGFGWRSPNSNNMCGEPIPRTDGNGDYGQESIAELIALIPAGYRIASMQCWGDGGIGDSDFDFNDLMFVVAVREDVTPTATPIITQIPKTSLSNDAINIVLLGILFVSSGIGLYKITTLLKEQNN